MLLQEAASERTIDRDLDQTALHIHAKNEVCPTCSSNGREFDAHLEESNQQFAARIVKERREAAARLTGEVADDGRHVSPAILEFRIQELEKTNQNLTELYAQACRDRDAAIERVSKFERFTDILANHLDALLQIANPPQPKPDYPRAA